MVDKLPALTLLPPGGLNAIFRPSWGGRFEATSFMS